MFGFLKINYMKYVIFLLIAVVFIACSNNQTEPPSDVKTQSAKIDTAAAIDTTHLAIDTTEKFDE